MAFQSTLDFPIFSPSSVVPESGRANSFAPWARRVLTALARSYPAELRDEQLGDVERMAFQLGLVFRPGAALADLGGGVGLFTPGAAALGMKPYLLDDFGDPVNGAFSLGAIGLHRELGVEVVETDVRKWGAAFADESLDVVTSFDSIEHWHHSPRSTFKQALRILKPGGQLLIGAPNAVNLRKRLTVPLGRSNWSHFEDWYYPEEFRGHVREPVLADLRRVVEELGFRVEGVWGRNWAGYERRGRAQRQIVALLDRVLRPFPTLCSDLYVLARRP